MIIGKKKELGVREGIKRGKKGKRGGEKDIIGLLILI